MNQLPSINVNPDTFFSEDFTLPALPKILTQVREAMCSEDTSISEIADLISTDPALVVQILKLVNSAYYGLPKKIGEVKLAVAYLGSQEVYRIVLSLSVINSLATDEKTEFDKIWLHSLYTSLCVKHITQRYQPLLASGELWAAAIVHDIGKLVYLKFFPDHYKELARYAAKNGCLYSEAEEKYAVPSSASLGMLLCEYWDLPDVLKLACGYHSFRDLRTPAEADSVNSMISLITIGNLVAVLAMNELTDEKRSQVINGIYECLGIDESEFLFLMADIYELKEAVQNFME